MPKPRILVIDDEVAIRDSLKMTLEYEGYEFVGAATGQEGLALAEREAPDLVLLDVKMPGMDGIEVLERLRNMNDQLPILVISGHGTISTAVEATKKGAWDFIEKPFASERVLVSLRNALDQRQLRDENRVLKKAVEVRHQMIGESGVLKQIMASISRAAPTNATVLITGESGVGKELVARTIHRNSLRSRERFVQVNCAAIPEELIESELFGHEKGSFTGAHAERDGFFVEAHGGTLFLDEVAELPLYTQVLLLRAIQEKRVRKVGATQEEPADVRIICATHQNLTVLTKAQAVKLTLTGTRCTGLEFLLDGTLHSVGASREVILCAGAIHTPRLLLLSGIGPHDDLERLGIHTVVDLPGVGANLQDHPMAAGLCFEAKHPLPPPNNNLAGSTFFWKSRPGLGRPDLMFLSVQFPLVSHEIGAQYPIPPNAFAIIPNLVRVRSRGYLRMKTAEPNAPLEIQPNFLAEQVDVDALAAGIELGLDIASQPAFRALIKRRVAPPRRLSRGATVAFIRRSCLSYHHPIGTCAMGLGREAVVDAGLRVRGIEGLRIADASVMPTIPSANTQAPTVMIGEFASSLLVPDRVAARESSPLGPAPSAYTAGGRPPQ
jgi:choline dehydrogenase-like flavoprotein